MPRLLSVPLLIGVLCATAPASSFLTQYATQRSVRSITPDGSRLWLATSGGIVRYSPSGGAVRTYADPGELRDIDLAGGVRDAVGILWFAARSGYVVRMDPVHERFTWYNSLAYAGWDVRSVTLYRGHLLLGSSKGLSFFSLASGTAVANAKGFGTLTDPAVLAVATHGDTIAVVLEGGLAWVRCPDPDSLNFNDASIWTVVPDTGKQGVVFDTAGMSLRRGRVQRVGATLYEVEDSLIHNPDGSVADTLVRVYRDGAPFQRFGWGQQYAFGPNWFVHVDTSLYMGTEGGWLYHVDGHGQLHQDTLHSPSAEAVTSCVPDGRGTLWYVTRNISDGVGQYADGKWSVLWNDAPANPNPQAPAGFGSTFAGKTDGLGRLLLTTTGDVWVGTWAHGAKWYRRSDGRWRSFLDTMATPVLGLPWTPNPIVRIAENPAWWWAFVGGMCEDSLGYIWLGNERAYNGNVLHVFDPATERWRSFNEDSLSLPGRPGSYLRGLSAARDRSSGTCYLYAAFYERELPGGFGFTVLSYTDPLSGAVSARNAPAMDASASATAVVGVGLAWVAANKGLYRLRHSDPDSLVQMRMVQSPLLAVAASPAGRPVFGMNGDLYEYVDSSSAGGPQLVNLTSCGALGTVYEIRYDGAGACYWISSSKGIFRFRTGEYVNPPVDTYDDVLVYPNPLSLTRGSRTVTFERLALKSRVLVYDVAGNLLWQSGGEGAAHGRSGQIVLWDGRNTGGGLVKPGTYFYYVYSGEKRRSGKLLVIP